MREHVVFIMFDLPVCTKEDRRDYRIFKRELKSSGFIKYQESVYVKLINNKRHYPGLVDRLKQKSPEKGLINIMIMTLTQFCDIIYINDEQFDKKLFADNCIII